MEDMPNGRSSFWTQANALMRKNLTAQKRNNKTNIRLVVSPIFICLLLVLIQKIVDNALDNFSKSCGCICVDTDENGQCEKRCGFEYSSLDQMFRCPIPHPPEWSPLLQLPAQQYRAVRTDFLSYGDLADDSCKKTSSCPVTMLITGNNQTFGKSVAGNMFPRSLNIDFSDILYSQAHDALGTEVQTEFVNFLDPAYFSNVPVDYVLPVCASNSQFSVPIPFGSSTLLQELRCIQGLYLWRNSSVEINDELYKGYHKGNSERKINEIIAAYDFMNSNENHFNVTIWYNSTYKNDTGIRPIAFTRLPRSVNLVPKLLPSFMQ